MRGREFLMKDGYSFDIDAEAARRSYNRMFISYMRTFARLGLKAIPMRADTGPIGGDLSHEFHILAETGESEVFVHTDFIDLDWSRRQVDYDADLQPLVDELTGKYAVTEEKRDKTVEARLGDHLVSARGIEVGHIFYFGTKYSRAMNAVVSSPMGDVPVEMGSYGIGVSRLVGALIEANHDEAGIIWPEPVAPFQLGLINLKKGDPGCDAVSEQIHAAFGTEVLYDDRDERAGVKFAEMDLIGLPWQIAVGPKGLAAGIVEVKQRAGGQRSEMTLEAVLNRFAGSQAR
jgi:prolyl-tRNA synthetase